MSKFLAVLARVKGFSQSYKGHSNCRNKRILVNRRGVLTFEWVILITLLVLGVVGGYTAFRDGVIDELGDICGAMLSVDQSFETTAPEDLPCAGSWGSWTDDDAADQMERGRNL